MAAPAQRWAVDENTGHFGGAGRPTCVGDIVEVCADAEPGVERLAWLRSRRGSVVSRTPIPQTRT